LRYYLSEKFVAHINKKYFKKTQSMLSNEKMVELSQDSVFDPEVMGGSIKRKIVNPVLVRERERCTFDKAEAYKVLFPEDQR